MLMSSILALIQPKSDPVIEPYDVEPKTQLSTLPQWSDGSKLGNSMPSCGL